MARTRFLLKQLSDSVLSMNQCIWARGNIYKNNIGLFICKIYIVFAATLSWISKSPIQNCLADMDRGNLCSLKWSEFRLLLRTILLSSLHCSEHTAATIGI